MARDFPNPQAGQTWSEQSARAWRNLVEEVRRLKGLISTGGLNIPSGAKGRRIGPTELRSFGVRRFVIENAADFPDTFSVSDTAGSIHGIGHVARPYLLRRTPFHGKSRDGISYTYSSNVARTASKTTPGNPPTTKTETQSIVPKYLPGDVIYAVRHVYAGEEQYPLAQGSVELISTNWVDLNVDGRYWAKSAT